MALTLLTLYDYYCKLALLKPKCRWCNAAMGRAVIIHYDHPGGYLVDGMAEFQWLYIRCPDCLYEWSFRKLGIREN